MKKFLYFIFLLLNFEIFAQSGFVWAKQFSGKEADFGMSVAVDKYNNVYSTGYFRDTVDFNPGAGVYNLISKGQTTNTIFISKLDAIGNFIWAKQIGGKNGQEALSIAVDASDNIYITGYFKDTVDFNPGPGIFNLISTPNSNALNIFVCKLNSSGNLVWAKSMEGSWGIGRGIAVSNNGVFVTGWFTGAIDFDPGSGQHIISPGSQDVFVFKLDTAGDFVWAKNWGCQYYDWGYSIAVDTFGYSYITGVTCIASAFISKIDVNGNFVWTKEIIDANGLIESFGIAVDRNQNIYYAGGFQETVDFDPGPANYSLTSIGGWDAFVSKLDSSGNFIWAKKMGGKSSNTSNNAIIVDGQNYLFMVGQFQDTVDFDPGIGIHNLASAGMFDIYISKLDAVGNFICADNLGGTGTDESYSITLGKKGDIYLTGDFENTADFNPGAGIFNLNSAGNSDIFVAVFRGCSTVGVDEITNENSISIFPNPSSRIFTIGFNKIITEAKICVYDLLGNCLLNKVYENNVSPEIDLSEQAKGMYLVEIISDSKKITQKIIVE